jgi:hypothetical protein
MEMGATTKDAKKTETKTETGNHNHNHNQATSEREAEQIRHRAITENRGAEMKSQISGPSDTQLTESQLDIR